MSPFTCLILLNCFYRSQFHLGVLMFKLSVLSWRPWRLCGSNVFVFYCNYGSGSAQIAQRRIQPAIRGICAISAASAGLPAGQKCQFSASLPHIRLPFQRMYCKICSSCCWRSDFLRVWSLGLSPLCHEMERGRG